jgi:hypothetical protein
MSVASSFWAVTTARAQAGFWRAAADVTGFALHHPRVARAIPLGLLAVTAFILGRAAGQLAFLGS